MENTKRCPYCGKEILAVAKKCKYCGEWLDEEHKPNQKKAMIPCPVCGERIEEGTEICPYCHEKIQLTGNNGTKENSSDISQSQTDVEKQIPIKRMITCPICCEEIEEGIEVCPYCHEKINKGEITDNRAISNEQNLISSLPTIQDVSHSTSSDRQESEETENRFPSFFNLYFIDPFFRHYADFKGKISRKQFWMSYLFEIIISMVFYCLDLLFGTKYVFSLIYGLTILVPCIAICVRRLHDVGKSGLWYLIAGIPIIDIWLIVLFCRKGESECVNAKYQRNDIIISVIAGLIIIISLIVFFHRDSISNDDTAYSPTEETETALEEETYGVLEEAISPDGNYDVRIVQLEDPKNVEEGTIPKSEIQIKRSGEDVFMTLVSYSLSNSPENDLEGFSNLVWSPNSEYLYFVTSSGATFGSIHRININTTNQEFVANCTNIIGFATQGIYAGYLVCNTSGFENNETGRHSYVAIIDDNGEVIDKFSNDDGLNDAEILTEINNMTTGEYSQNDSTAA